MDSKEKILLSKYVSSKRTICEVHREIYDILLTVEENDKSREAIKLIEEAFVMAKKMNNKLFEYKKNWDVGFFKKESKENKKIKKEIRGKR